MPRSLSPGTVYARGSSKMVGRCGWAPAPRSDRPAGRFEPATKIASRRHLAPSSSGLGHHPLKVATRVRIPLGLLSRNLAGTGSSGFYQAFCCQPIELRSSVERCRVLPVVGSISEICAGHCAPTRPHKSTARAVDRVGLVPSELGSSGGSVADMERIKRSIQGGAVLGIPRAPALTPAYNSCSAAGYPAFSRFGRRVVSTELAREGRSRVTRLKVRC